MARRMGSSGGQRGGGGLDVYVCVCLREVGVGQIGERGEKMQKCLCHVSMEINKLCCMHNTPYHTCMQVYTQSTQGERERERRRYKGAACGKMGSRCVIVLFVSILLCI